MTAETAQPGSNLVSKHWPLGLVIFLLILAGVGAYIANAVKWDYIPKRFGVVDQGIVYRSGQISGGLIKSVLKEYDIRTIIDLQGHSSDPAQAVEQQTARELGVAYHEYPLSGDGTGKIEHYAEAIQTLVESKKAGKAVLIHCSAGTQRTGVAVAYYRMLVQHQSPEEAHREMEQFDWSDDHDAKVIPYINDHMGELAQMLVKRGVIDQVPSPLPQLQ